MTGSEWPSALLGAIVEVVPGEPFPPRTSSAVRCSSPGRAASASGATVPIEPTALRPHDLSDQEPSSARSSLRRESKDPDG